MSRLLGASAVAIACPIPVPTPGPIDTALCVPPLVPSKLIISSLVAVTQGIAQVPPDTQQDNFGLKVTGASQAPAPRHLKGCLGFMDRLSVAEGSKYKCYFARAARVFATQPDSLGLVVVVA